MTPSSHPSFAQHARRRLAAEQIAELVAIEKKAKAITRELNGLPAADRHICDQLLDRMERVIRFEDAWFPFYQGEVDTLTPPVKAKRVLPTGPTAKQVWKDTRARQGAFARGITR